MAAGNTRTNAPFPHQHRPSIIRSCRREVALPSATWLSAPVSRPRTGIRMPGIG